VEELFSDTLLQLDVKITGSGYCPMVGVRIVDVESGSATTVRVCVVVCVYILSRDVMAIEGVWTVIGIIV
jgi:hypothetical protein